MEKYERELDHLEDVLMRTDDSSYINTVNEIRGNVRDLRVHYAQLIDLSQELEENENDFFQEDNLRYFHMFTNRMVQEINF